MSLALDGSAHGTGVVATTCSATLTTSNAGDIIMVVVTLNHGPLLSVTSPNLTFALYGRQTLVNNGSGDPTYLDIWKAVAAGALSSEVITATQSGSDYITMDAFGVSGANTSSPFDANGSLPAVSPGIGSDVVLSTTSANTFIFCGYRMAVTANPTAGAGFTLIHGSDNQGVIYKIVSAAQTSLDCALTTGSGDMNGGVGGAIVMASAAGLPSGLNYKWPLPIARPNPIYFAAQPQGTNELLMTLAGKDALPFRKLLWPNPILPRYLPIQIAQGSPENLTLLFGKDVLPFRKQVWPVPVTPLNLIAQTSQPQGTADNLTNLYGQDALPFRQMNWPLPPRAQQPVPPTAANFRFWLLITSGATYTLTLAQGVYTITGQALNMLAARVLPLGQGSYTVTGQPINLVRGYKLALAQGVYSISGQAVNLLRGYRLALAQGSYSIAGQALGMLAARKLILTQGVYSIAGQSLAMLAARKMALAQGAYSITGQVLGMFAGRRLPMAAGVYSVTGQPLSMLHRRILSLASGAYSIIGQALTFLKGTVSQYGITPRFVFIAEQRNRTVKPDLRDRTFHAPARDMKFNAAARVRRNN